MKDYPYQVYDRCGNLVLSAAQNCRYSPETELGFLLLRRKEKRWMIK